MSDDIITRVRRHAFSGERVLGDPVSQPIISRAESDLGFTLPPLLVRLYTEIANGGFGPGHGLLGLVDPCENDDQTIVGLYRESLAEHENPDVEYEFKKGVIFFCNWGCAIYTCVDCNSLDAQLVTYDFEAHMDALDA